MTSKYAMPKVEEFLNKHQIDHYWRRRGNRVYVTCELKRETNALVSSLLVDKLEFYLKQHYQKARLTSQGSKTATYFMYDIIDLLKST